MELKSFRESRRRRWSRRLARLHLLCRLPGEPVALLDYDRHRIHLGISSPMEYHTRLHSCKKEPETIAWIEQVFRAGDVFYDIGANVGTYSLVSAAYWRDLVQVVAFEPSAINYARLVRNLLLNGFEKRVIPLAVALAEKTSLSTFHYENFTAGGSLHALGERKDFRDKDFSPTASCPMMAFDLDTLVGQLGLPQPTHLKLDVDGTELLILQGAHRTLQGVRSILVELDDSHPQTPQVRALLREQGFKEAAHYRYRYGNLYPKFRGISNVIFHKRNAESSNSG